MKYMNSKVNLFIVGAAKAGTTSMYEYFNQSSSIYCSEVKEPWYFTDMEKYTDSKRTANLKEYEALYDFSKASKYYLDASVSYLAHPQVAHKIWEYNPEAKIIIMLREPTKRLISYYKMYKKRQGFDCSLKEFIDQTFTALPKLEAGLYYEQVKTYIELFKDQVKIIIFEELIENPKKIEEELQQFLEIDDLELSMKDKFNQSKEERFRFATRFIHQTNPVKDFLKKIVKSRKLKDKVKNSLLQLNEKESSIQLKTDQETMIWLKNYYQEDIIKLEELLGRVISKWHKE